MLSLYSAFAHLLSSPPPHRLPTPCPPPQLNPAVHPAPNMQPILVRRAFT